MDNQNNFEITRLKDKEKTQSLMLRKSPEPSGPDSPRLSIVQKNNNSSISLPKTSIGSIKKKGSMPIQESSKRVNMRRGTLF